ncbi:Uncharacterized protein At4g02000 [Linum perenne]
MLIRFEHEVDLRRVMEVGPWSFDQNLLILRELKPGEKPKEVELYAVDFWVRVYRLPAGFFSKTVGVALGNFIGTFMEYDEKNSYSFDDPYMRIRVTVDIRKPLRREKRLRKANGESALCDFKYERLPNFCYICGKIGHIDRYCEILYRVPTDKIERLWSKDLRAPSMKKREMTNGRWLNRREEAGAGASNSILGGREGAPSYSDELEKIPAGIRGLVGNTGASRLTESAVVAYGRQAVTDEEKEMEIGEERKRRREDGTVSHMEGIEQTGGKVYKSPKKNVHNTAGAVQAARADSGCARK